jgi:hypothetical protein
MFQSLINHPIFKPVADQPTTRFWFALSLVYPLYYGIVSLINAFSHPFTVQDDVRQHIFWMGRFIDPELFRQDLIADYFQTINPIGFKAFYWGLAQLGIHPLVLAKVLPLFLGVIAAGYGFGIAMQLFPIPAGAFIASLFLNQALWLEDDIITGASRSFLYPLFLAFLYYLLKRSPIPCLVCLMLQGIFYPSTALVEVGTLTVSLVRWNRGKLRLSGQRRDYLFWILAVGIIGGLLVGFSGDLSKFEPLVTVDQMRSMPEFQPGGRLPYFNLGFGKTWLKGDGAMLPDILPPIIVVSVLLPWLCQRRLPLTELISPKIRLFSQLLIASLGLFGLAHLLLLKLYFPSRFASHSLRVVMALSAGIVVTILLETGRCWLVRRRSRLILWQQGSIALTLLLAIASLVGPAIPSVFLAEQGQNVGSRPQIYHFLAQQPKDSLIASLSEEVDNIPVFSQRSVLVSRETALPYHLGYYNPIRQRVIDLINAQYSSNLADVKALIQKYEIDFFLIDRRMFNLNELMNNQGSQQKWLLMFQPAMDRAIEQLRQKEPSALLKSGRQCSVLRDGSLSILDAACILKL